MLINSIVQQHQTSAQNVKNVSTLDQEETTYRTATNQSRQSLTESV